MSKLWGINLLETLKMIVLIEGRADIGKMPLCATGSKFVNVASC